MRLAGFHAFVLLLGGVLFENAASACAVCFGEPGAPMTRGLTWAIISLGGIVGLVLAGVAGFFVHVNRRSQSPPESKSDDAPVNR
ncbi:MAG TPA: hypothetical protein PKO21_15275 [Verrucomicrobiota bacterium]|nr:hypothetical protein [Verrucomicrobiota bacterium]